MAARRSVGRYLAPIALVAAGVAIYLVVHSELEKTHASTSAHHPALVRTTGASRTSHRVTSKPRFYVVKSGDSLSSISVKTGVSLGTIESLNPSVNPNALQTGQHLRLR